MSTYLYHQIGNIKKFYFNSKPVHFPILIQLLIQLYKSKTLSTFSAKLNARKPLDEHKL